MRSLFYDIHRTVMNAVERAGYPLVRVLSLLGISRSWYYAQMDFSPLLDGRFNPFAARALEWIVIGYKHRHPEMSFKELAYAMMDKDIAYLSPGTVYSILKRNNRIVEWKRPSWESTRSEKAKHPDERWQTDIMYIKITGRFFYLLIFIDEYSRYIVHHALLTSMDADSVLLEAQSAIDRLRRDSLAEPIIQSDNGSAFIAMEFKLVMKENRMTHKLIRPHTPEQNAIVERANKTMREELVPMILMDYEKAKSEISRIVYRYNNERRHSSLQYLTPVQCYRGDPGTLLAVRESDRGCKSLKEGRKYDKKERR